MLRISLALLAASSAPALAQLQVVERVSVSSTGAQGDNHSQFCDISNDGRFVVFASFAQNLLPGDLNDAQDVFVHDRWTGSTELCSVSSAGQQTDRDCHDCVISGDGRYVAFMSAASNLTPGLAGNFHQVFVHDRVTGATELVSRTPGGLPGNHISTKPSLSADGSLVAFESNATNLDPRDTDQQTDIYIHDRTTGVTRVASRTSSGGDPDGSSRSPFLSGDGRVLAFSTNASNMGLGDQDTVADIYAVDLQTGTLQQVSLDASGGQVSSYSTAAPISRDGRWIPFSTPSNGVTPDDLDLSADVFVRDMLLGTTVLASGPSVDGGPPVHHAAWCHGITPDGRYVTFRSSSPEYLDQDTNGVQDVFVHDLWTGITELVSCRSDGMVANSWSSVSKLSADGRFVAYLSTATDLVPGTDLGFTDVYVLDRRQGGLQLFVNGDLAGATAVLHLREGAAGAHVAVTWSLGAQALTGGPFGLLSQPVSFLTLPLALDAAGARDLALVLPPSFAGQTLWLQAIDGGTGLLSNSFRIEVQ